MIEDRLAQTLDRVTAAAPPEDGAFDRFLRHLDRVLSRARAAGLVRPELEPRDVAAAVVMVLATVRPRLSGGCDGDWRRYMALLLDGMRPAPIPLPARAQTGVSAPTAPV